MCDHNTPSSHHVRHGIRLEDGHAHTCDHIRWSRRDFLSTLGMAAFGGSVGLGSRSVQAFGALAHYPEALESDRILVLIQLDGGNDGLNTLVPFRNDVYYNARPNVSISSNVVLPISDEIGLHPALASLERRYQDGEMAIVQNVGYDQPVLSHFRSTDIWTSASDSEEIIQTGWVGRYLQNAVPNFMENPPEQPLAVQIGGPSLMFQSSITNMGMSIRDLDRFERLVEEGRFYRLDGVPATAFGDEMMYLRDIANSAFRYAEAIQDAAQDAENTADYPDSFLAESLRVVARLIKGGLGSRIYMVSLPGFDTHANQLDEHEQLLREMAEGVDAFFNDLPEGSIKDNLAVMTFSEFGRRVEENGSAGTDHGTSAPLFIFGKGVEGGLWGTSPSLTDLDAEGNMHFETEFRQVYASVLRDWFGLDAATATALLGGTFAPIDGLLPGVSSVATQSSDVPITFSLEQNHPNPFHTATTIRFTLHQPSPIQLDVIDVRGRLVQRLLNAHRSSGTHEVVFDAETLPSGPYFYRLQTGASSQTRPMLLVR